MCVTRRYNATTKHKMRLMHLTKASHIPYSFTVVNCGMKVKAYIPWPFKNVKCIDSPVKAQ